MAGTACSPSWNMEHLPASSKGRRSCPMASLESMHCDNCRSKHIAAVRLKRNGFRISIFYFPCLSFQPCSDGVSFLTLVISHSETSNLYKKIKHNATSLFLRPVQPDDTIRTYLCLKPDSISNGIERKHHCCNHEFHLILLAQIQLCPTM
jgi:hypothetical protein